MSFAKIAEKTEGTNSRNEQEVGFLYLEECEVDLSSSALADSSSSLPLSQWLKVQIPPPLLPNEQHAAPMEGEDCFHCRLVLHPKIEEVDDTAHKQSLCLNGSGPRFDGTVHDVKATTCSCKHRLRQRSDAALIMGLALACQDLQHISINSIQIAFWNQSNNQALCAIKKERQNNIEEDTTRTRRASLVITFSIPEITSPQHQSHKRIRSKPQSTKRRFISNSSKPLPPSTQLILSILSSDWDALERILHDSAKPTNNQHWSNLRPSVLFFPPKLSLDEVYKRIGGARTFFDEENTIDSLGVTDEGASEFHITDLPKDVLKYHIGIYLRARSLDALRCTCKIFHQVLRSVVPGLTLRLFSHQVKSLSWMRLRETKVVTENDLAIQQNTNSHRDDYHRAVSGGASVMLRSRFQPSNDIRISQYNGEEISVRSDDPLSRSVARGGLLCDDPGLGKTITVVSLILQTLGLSTESASTTQENELEDHTNSDACIFAEYWREAVVPEFRVQALSRLLSAFLRSSHEADYFVHPVDPELDLCPDYLDIVKNPICFKDIRLKINAHAYGESFALFRADVDLCFENAIHYNPVDSAIHDAALRLTERFLDCVGEFKQKQVQVAKKSFGRASSKPNSAVAALVERNNSIRLKKSLVPSAGTLLVVPSVLLEHWQDQLRLHVNTAYCTDKPPIVFEYTGTTESGLELAEVLVQTHFPYIFVDKTGTKKLPSPHILSMFSVVITTTQRFTNEWRNGSFEDELKRGTSDESATSRYDYRTSLAQSESSCPLLQVNWLRMVVDEGHSMGRGKDNSAISFASWVSAERRWAMTGTPTRQTVSQSGLKSILHLMQYLQHGFFSRRQDGETVWQNLVARGWSRGLLSSFCRLRSLLTLFMVRHTKSDIEELPVPCYQTTVLPMSAEEVKTYNTLVCAVQSNLLITSMKGKTSGAQDSLLNRSQARHAKDALRNVRLVCSGGTQVIPTISTTFYAEFMRDFDICNPSPHKIDEMKQYLARATTEQLSPCGCCGVMLTTLLVFPCGDLVCTECVDAKSNCCIVCDEEFDVDVFQRLQPGMDYQWLHNIEETSKKAKRADAEEGISDDDQAGNALLLEGGAGILAPNDANRQRRRTRKPGDGHECHYSPKDMNGECELCWKEHGACNLMAEGNRCNICYRQAEMCPTSETKSFYIVDKLVKLHKSNKKKSLASPINNRYSESSPMAGNRSLKVIVFSQFRKVLNMAGDRLLRRFGTACVAEYWGHYRRQELHKFIYEDDCFCMLLGKDGSEGLDLSFVTHIIFLEQVWDKSLEQQAVARAWRMGAKGSVAVETLVAETSVEETMACLERSLEGDSHTNIADDDLQAATEAGKTSEYQRAKLHFLLKGLRLITNPYTTSFGGTKRKIPEASTESLKPQADRKPKKLRVRFQKLQDSL